MKPTNLKGQVDKKYLLSDFNIEFHLKQERKDKILQIKEKHLNHILFLLEGEMNISYHEFRNHLCRAGEMIFIPQDSIATAEAFTEIKYLLLSFNNQIILHEDMNWNELKEFDGERNVFHKLDIRPPLPDVLESISFYHKNKIACTYLDEVKEKEIFLMLKVFYSKQEVARFLKPLLKQDMDFKAYVIKHYINAKNVEELAKLCDLSVRAFTRKFKMHFDDSPYRWILRQKANQIKILLADKKISLQAIIKEYGFSSPAHFTTYCKKQFGQTPSAYRNSLNGKLNAISPDNKHTDSTDF
ncbi:MAG: AraC family transcriptional regulator [Tannerellaceae bacterium]|jgi:AraC-like DNA-binding protein|nr:AraC family transcriptional regulator [Tannerellaceae bacterium]